MSRAIEVSRMVKFLNDARVTNDKKVHYYCGKASDYHPAIELWDTYTGEICLWFGEFTHELFRTMLSEVRTDYRTLPDKLYHNRK